MGRTNPTPFLRTGTGEPLLLIHPFMLSHHVWRAVAADLSSHYEVLAPTMPGHWGGPALKGRTLHIEELADGIERHLDNAGWDTCHIAGNSLGGWVSLELARRGRARSVSAIAPAGGWERLSANKLQVGLFFLSLYPLTRIGGAVGDRVTHQRRIRNLVLELVSKYPGAVAEEDFDALLSAATHCAGHMPLIAGNLSHGGIDGLSEITTPVQLISCENDRIVPPRRYARKFIAELPGTLTQVTLPDIGHVPMLENPELVARTIDRFITAVTGTASEGSMSA